MDVLEERLVFSSIVGTSMILYSFMDKQYRLSSAIVITILASIIIPTLSWFGIKLRNSIMKNR